MASRSTARPARRAAKAAARRRVVPQPRWILLSVALVIFLGILMINGVVHGDIRMDALPPAKVGYREVPTRILNGGPVIDGVHRRSWSIPRRTIVLTFDDGPDPQWTPQILAVLRRHQVPATFFVIGKNAARYPQIVREARATGSEIGVHTFTHPFLGSVPDWRLRFELSQTQLAVAGAAGITSSLLRPPYLSHANGVDNASWHAISQASAQGYLTVLSDVDSRDWARPGVDTIVRNAIPPRGSGAVLLFHDGGGDRAQTVSALDRLIPTLRKKGYHFATVSQALRFPPSNPTASVGERNRGLALVWAVWAATTVTKVAVGFLLVAGALVLLRVVLMVVVAFWHVRTRRRRRWGPPVTEPVSVVVPAYNEKENIADTVRSLVESDHPLEVVVVDDGSTDGTADIAEGLGLPDVTVVRKPNGGKPSALNAGVAHARHDLIVMMDGDTVFERDTVRRLVQPFADPRVGAVAGNAKVANRKTLIGRWQHIEYVIGFNIDRRVYDVLHCMGTVPGAVGAFRREALVQVNGVSDDTLAEDTDLTMAISRAGWWVVYEESAKAWTEAPASFRQLWKQRYRWSYGTIQAMWKHRAAVFHRGPSGRFGRRGLLNIALFQVALPLCAPMVDVFLLYGLVFLDPWKTLGAWLAMVAAQLLAGLYAFRLDREKARVLWWLPLQQIFYRQLMYAVLIHSVVTALAGARLGWHKLKRSGGLNALVSPGVSPAAEERTP